jgi:hypothetical protein
VGLVENLDNQVDKLDVQSLRVIRAIADFGSVTRAAQEMGFSPLSASSSRRSRHASASLLSTKSDAACVSPKPARYSRGTP